MLSDVFFWTKIKALRIAFKPLCCKCTQKVVNMGILLGLWGQRSSPIQTVQGLWHLTTCFLPTRLCTAKKTKKKNSWRSGSKVMSKSMIKHLCRQQKRQTVVFSHVWKKQNKKQKDRCWNPDNTNTLMSPMATWKMKPLKNKNKNKQVKCWHVLIQISFWSCLLRLPSVHNFQTCFG